MFKIISTNKNVFNVPPMNIFKFTVLTLALGLSACSYSPDKNGSSNQTKKMAEQNAQTAAVFNRISGTYSGTLSTSTGPEQVQITLSTLAVSEGIKNPDGSDRIRVTLSAAYLRITPVERPLVNFAISFTPETGELTLINQDDKAKKDLDEVNTVFASILGDKLTGVVRSATHELGLLSLQKVSNGSSTTPTGAQEEYNDRLRKQYSELAGTYLGCVIPAEGGSLTKPYTAKMLLSVYEDNTDPKNPVPTLAGNFHRDTDKTDGTDTALTATYRPDLTPATLTILGKPYISNNGYISTFTGNYLNGDYSGTFTSNKKGLEGMIYMHKGTKYPKQCAGAVIRMEFQDSNP